MAGTEMEQASASSNGAEEPPQVAAFEIEGPDKDGWVWICSAEGRGVWCQNLGPVEAAAAVMTRWLASIDPE